MQALDFHFTDASFAAVCKSARWVSNPSILQSAQVRLMHAIL